MNSKSSLDRASGESLKAPVALVIDGDEFSAEDTFTVTNPSTGVPCALCPAVSDRDLERAVTAARNAFHEWSKTPIDERAAIIEQFADGIEESKTELAELLSMEQGKTVHKGAIGEIGGAIAWTRATAKLRPLREVIRDDESGKIEVNRKPLGVVGSITPWNFPVMIAIWHFVPALLAGNTVIVKPSSSTPLSTLRLIQIANKYFPSGVINSVAGSGGLGSAIAEHPGIDKIVFTGSTPTGRDIMKRGSVNLKRLTLELGGNDAAIVLPDVNVDDIAEKIFLKSFGNSGQICAAIKRLYVHEDVHDRLAEKLAEMAKSSVVGAGNDPNTQFGPVQNRKQFEYVRDLANNAAANGGKFLAGGIPDYRGGGYFFPLTVVVDVKDGMDIVDEEQFGPILPIIRYSDPEEVLKLANANEFGLGGSVWSSDVAKAAELAQRLECGSAWVNDHSSIAPDVPFGGAKQSGFGIEFGLHGLDEFMQLQTLRTPKE